MKALAGLNHPHIVTVHDTGHDARGVYYVMEYIPGVSLREWLQNHGETMPPLNQVCRMFEQILRGVAFAHGKGIIHRDLKPENVIITDDSMVKVLDFGLAKIALDDSISIPGQRMGTPLYMAPEQTFYVADQVFSYKLSTSLCLARLVHELPKRSIVSFKCLKITCFVVLFLRL